MHYAEVTQRLYALTPRGMRLGLGRMRRACALRGHPERALSVVHVAGTNGKGSVIALLDAALGQAGIRVGAFTSPHLHSYTERFRIAGEPVDPGRLASHAEQLLRWMEQPGSPQLTFFEVSTLLAFELFRDEACEIALIEVGLGGRLDSTNVVSPLLSVITHIGRDHADRLGETLGEIAREKAGILKPGVPAVVGASSPEARRAIAAVARDQRVPVRWRGQDFGAESSSEGVRVWAGERELLRVRPGLHGEHQLDHVATAYACLPTLREHGFRVPDAAFRSGMSRAHWPGRLEWVVGKPRVLLDAAHNPDGARALARYLEAQPRPKGKIVLLFGAMADKEVSAMLGALRAVVDLCVLTRPAGGRGADPALLARARDLLDESPGRAFESARVQAGPSGWVVVAGSIFLMAEVRGLCLGIESEPPLRL